MKLYISRFCVVIYIWFRLRGLLGLNIIHGCYAVIRIDIPSCFCRKIYVNLMPIVFFNMYILFFAIVEFSLDH